LGTEWLAEKKGKSQQGGQTVFGVVGNRTVIYPQGRNKGRLRKTTIKGRKGKDSTETQTRPRGSKAVSEKGPLIIIPTLSDWDVLYARNLGL